MKILELAVLVVVLVWMPARAAIDDRPAPGELPRPAAGMQPDDVVRTVIGALAHNDRPYADAGIETTYRFASPANKVNTGPLERFIRMVKARPYGVMVDHAASEFSEVVYSGDTAYQLVRLTAADGRVAVFAFRLSKQQDGEFENMWMTDAVWPVDTAADPGQPL